MARRELLRVLVRLARDADRRISTERPHQRRVSRENGGRDATLLHIVERFLDGPVRNRWIVGANQPYRLQPARRRYVVMYIDTLHLLRNPI